MSKYVAALDQARHTNKLLFSLSVLALVVAAFAMIGWRSAPRDLTLHVPPSLSTGADIKVGRGDVPDPNVYTFGFYIWQQVNRWSKNGQDDYGSQIFKLQAFFTPACLTQLQGDMKLRSDQGELVERTRSIMEIQGLGFSDGRVEKISDGQWRVLVDTQVQETSHGMPVKDAYIRYPLRVVRFDVDRERNPWQLAVDCYGNERPERLDPKAVQVAVRESAGVVNNTDAYAKRDLGPGVVEDFNAAPPPSATGASSDPPSAARPGRSGAPIVGSSPPVANTPRNSVGPAVLPRPVNN